MSGILSEQSFQFENKFNSVQQLLNCSQEIMLSPSFDYGIPNKFKAIILLETYKKNTTIYIKTKNGTAPLTQDDLFTKMKYQFFSKWYVKATNKKNKVIDKIISKNTISKYTFLYRIKIAAKSNINKLGCQRFQNLIRINKENQFIKIQTEKVSVLSSKALVLSQNDQIGYPLSIREDKKLIRQNDYRGLQPNQRWQVVSNGKIIIEPLKQVLQDKLYKSFKLTPSSSTPLIGNPGQDTKNISKVANNLRSLTYTPNQHQNQKPKDKRNLYCQLINLIDKIKIKKLSRSFCSIKTYAFKQEQDLIGALLLAKRNLELTEINFQIENEVQQINDNYYGQIDRLDKLTQKIQDFQTNINYSRLVSMSKILKKLVYPHLKLFLENLKELYYPKIMESMKKQKYKIMEMKSGSVQSNDPSYREIPMAGLTSLNQIAEEDMFKLL